MAADLVGEFRPPRELASVQAPRVAGKGFLHVSESGLTVEGAIIDAPSFPTWRVSVGLLLLAVIVSLFVDRPTHILGPLTALALLTWFWARFRAEQGHRGSYAVPWSEVEHVVRLPSDPEVLGFVLAGPLAREGTPEQVFFAPTAGVEALIDALRADGPAALPIDLPAPFEAVD